MEVCANEEEEVVEEKWMEGRETRGGGLERGWKGKRTNRKIG